MGASSEKLNPRVSHTKHLVVAAASGEALQWQASVRTSNDTQHICNAPLPALPVLRCVYLLVEGVHNNLQVMVHLLATSLYQRATL